MPISASVVISPITDGSSDLGTESSPGLTSQMNPDPVGPTTNCATSIRPAMVPRQIFISRVHQDTTEEEIIEHISSHVSASRGQVACRRITPLLNRGGHSFSASFKVLVPDDLFSAVISPAIWPANSIVREFVPKTRSKSTASASPKNALPNCHSITPM